MISRLSAFIILLTISVTAQAQEKFILNEAEVQKTNTQQERLYYTLNGDVFENPEFDKGAVFEFTTLSGTKEYVITNRAEYLPGTVSIIAAVKGKSDNVFAATYSNGRFNGQIHESHQQTIFLGYENTRAKNYASLVRPEGTEPMACSVHDDDPSLTVYPSPPAQRFKAKNVSSNNYNSSASLAAVDDSVTIDILILYTEAAETWANNSEFGNMSGVITQSINLSQTALNNSGQRTELRLVHAYKTGYSDDNSETDAEDHLRRLTQNPINPAFGADYNGYMEDAHDLRDQYGADLVAAYMSNPNTGGIAWRLGSTAGSPIYGFSVNRVQQIANSTTLIHEVGHNMGNAHSRNQDDAAATAGGGLFQYSAGYKDSNAGFHTIMTYGDGLTNEAPIFSSPDLTFNGVPAGSESSLSPENNALSMRQIKRTIASYRPTQVQSPIAGLSTQSIEVTMNREEQRAVSFNISNTGASALVWDVDFDFVGGTLGKAVVNKEERKSIEPADISHINRRPFNYSGTENSNQMKRVSAPETIYSTSFESSDDFDLNSYTAVSEWRSITESTFQISSLNPSDGAQHIRFAYDGKTDSDGNPELQFMSSPFFGYQTLGNYEVTYSFFVSDLSEVYEMVLYDGKTDNVSGGIIIANNGTIFAPDRQEVGSDYSFFSTNRSVSAGTYYDLKIVFDTETERVNYYLDGSLITQNEFLSGAKTPGLLQIVHRNEVAGSYMDLDNFQVKKIVAPYSWLPVVDQTGVTTEGASTPVNLTFNTEGVSAGTYQTNLLVSTNDPNNEVMDVSITLNVQDVVSNEPEDNPKIIALDQNYPNPFNPSTTISYSLAEAQNVELAVFNLQGQKIATLENGKQPAGSHKVLFDATNLSSGVYVYRLKTAAQTLTRKMVLIK